VGIRVRVPDEELFGPADNPTFQYPCVLFPEELRRAAAVAVEGLRRRGLLREDRGPCGRHRHDPATAVWAGIQRYFLEEVSDRVHFCVWPTFYVWPKDTDDRRVNDAEEHLGMAEAFVEEFGGLVRGVSTHLAGNLASVTRNYRDLSAPDRERLDRLVREVRRVRDALTDLAEQVQTDLAEQVQTDLAGRA
jgi:hypothetical protein